MVGSQAPHCITLTLWLSSSLCHTRPAHLLPYILQPARTGVRVHACAYMAARVYRRTVQCDLRATASSGDRLNSLTSIGFLPSTFSLLFLGST